MFENIINNKIIFFYPSHDLGGAQTLFLRCIKMLHSNNIDVGYVDFNDGTLRKELIGTGVDFFDFSSAPFVFDFKVTLVTSFNYMNFSPLFFSGEVVFLFWVVSPLNMPVVNLSKKLNVDLNAKKYIKNRYLGFYNLDLSLSQKSVYFMDRLCFEVYGKEALSYDPFLPLYIDFKNKNLTYKFTAKSYNFAWVGRIDLSIKFNCVVFLVEKFIEYKQIFPNSFVNLTILATGAGVAKIRDICERSEFSKDIRFVEGVPYGDFHEFLSNNFDLVFAHGTTCLESASISIPTICLDGDERVFRSNYKFKWIFDRDDYDVGRTFFDENFSSRGVTFSEIVDSMEYRRGYLSKSSFLVIKGQYNSNFIIRKMVRAIELSDVNIINIKFNGITLLIDYIVHFRLIIKAPILFLKGFIKGIFK
ncbi:hypothetical protein [Marinomonas transparens]|uniref:Uncharacterized protein n=1 Tax=Marinomonas transparens TaxID=2795388 RepID=A0A934N2H0_9GAMM|nr:hypothetical protein [Marinomonas transparens]MBJ7537803.1 hypothetical protein [Marinomonas transparens]